VDNGGVYSHCKSLAAERALDIRKFFHTENLNHQARSAMFQQFFLRFASPIKFGDSVGSFLRTLL
jgi:hypothetical protein